MPFYLRKDTKRWFGDISNHFKVDFDMYYFCLMAGMAAKHKAAATSHETSELTDVFPGKYKKKARLIVACYLAVEIGEEHGLSLQDKKSAKNLIHTYLDPLSQTMLSARGMTGMNEYSWGGQDVLEDWFGDQRPRYLETFLIKYSREIGMKYSQNYK